MVQNFWLVTKNWGRMFLVTFLAVFTTMKISLNVTIGDESGSSTGDKVCPSLIQNLRSIHCFRNSPPILSWTQDFTDVTTEQNQPKIQIWIMYNVATKPKTQIGTIYSVANNDFEECFPWLPSYPCCHIPPSQKFLYSCLKFVLNVALRCKLNVEHNSGVFLVTCIFPIRHFYILSV